MSNIFQNIRTGLIEFFGKPDATDVELDQMVSELPSVESLAVAANEAAEEKYKNQLQSQADQIASLEAQLSDPERTSLVESLAERVQSLEQLNETLTGQIQTSKVQISALSKDLAASKALYRPKDQPADAPIPQASNDVQSIKVGDTTVTQTKRGTELSGDVWEQMAAKVKK
jgi:anion-transporting  ArsA/GET3 family ATPase